MSTPQLALARAERRLVGRLEELERRLDAGDDAWREYSEAAAALAAVAPLTVPGANGALLTTAEMAGRLGITSKTLLRKRARGEIQAAAVLGQRGRAALRWAAR